MKNYQDLYLKVDVLLLDCLFETSRKKTINSFELDHAHYLPTPGYIWNAMLRFTACNLELVSDIEKNQFIESTIRDGIEHCMMQLLTTEILGLMQKILIYIIILTIVQ